MIDAGSANKVTGDRILVTRRPPGSAVDMMAEAGAIELWNEDRAIPRDELVRRARTVTALYCMLTDRIDDALLDDAPRLRVISQMAVGVDNIDLDACTERRIPVGHTPDVLTETVADAAFGLLIAAARRFIEGIDYVRAGMWRRWEPDLLFGHDLHGSTLGIVGMGRVGLAVARRASGFGMTVLYSGRTMRPEASGVRAEFVSLTELYRRADHVIVTVALTPETRHVIDGAALRSMKNTATLVNVSRGATVDTEALIDALRSGRIAGAALDVADPEPLPGDHELLSLDNCLVLPHLGSSTQRTRAAMADLAARNVIAGLAGERLPQCANPEVYEV